MPLDTSFVGRSYPPTAPYQVGREKIREFAAAIGATDAAHHDPDAARALGHRDVVAPPTFPFVITMQANRQIVEDPALGVDYSRVVHGDQRFQYVRPVRAGDRLRCHPTVEQAYSKAGLDSLLLRLEIRTEADEPVVTVWTKLIARGDTR